MIDTYDVAQQIVALLKKYNFTIRPYEGEISACIVGNGYDHKDDMCIMDPTRYNDSPGGSKEYQPMEICK